MDILTFPENLLRELNFDDAYLTPEQEERLMEVINASMKYEQRIFYRRYLDLYPLDKIAKEEKMDVSRVHDIIDTTATRVAQMEDYILTGKYQRRKNRVAQLRTTLLFISPAMSSRHRGACKLYNPNHL